MRLAARHSNDTSIDSVLTAGLTLRIGASRLTGRVYWPHPEDANARAALIFAPSPQEAGDADALWRLLCTAVAATVLAIPSPHDTGRDHELAALGWAVEHAAELGAQPQQLMVAGEGAGGARAAWLALRARDCGWPALRRQILVYPTFTQTCPMPFLLPGVAPATVISSDKRIDDGKVYAERLRGSGVEVDVLDCSPAVLPGHDALSAMLSGRKR
jgi:hypothetical protein